MIKGYPKDYNLTVLDAVYHYPQKTNDNKWTKGAMTLVVKDNETGEKFHTDIEQPDYAFFKAKDDVVIEHNQFFIDKDDAEMVKVPYRELEKTIAEITGNSDFYFDNVKNGNRRANAILHSHPRLFMSDTNIEDHYRFRFNNFYENDSYKANKAFFDIEVDIKDQIGDFPMPGECPVNAIALINLENNTVYSLVLRNSSNPLIDKFEKSIGPDLFKKLKNLVIKTVGGKKAAKKFGVDKLEYNFIMFDEEIDLIRSLFYHVNLLKPDFLLVWNMAFDMPYIIQRIINLGYKPEDIICDQSFKYKDVKYVVDERSEVLAERNDFAKISAYTIYLDQMIQYASIRKGGHAVASHTLDYIGELEVGIKKLDYSHITTDIGELPYLDFETFIFYNIIDTIVQMCIEAKTNDVDFVFAKALANNTRYAKVHRQTVYLANRAAQSFFDYGFIVGNNVNKFNEKPTEKFPGAFVANTKKVSDYARVKINGRSINVYDLLIDFDYARLYPSITQELNAAPNTIIGKLKIPNQIYNKETQYLYGIEKDRYDRGAKFLEDMQPQMYIEFGARWFNLAGFSDLLKDIAEYFEYSEISSKTMNMVSGSNVIPVRKVNNELFVKPVSVVYDEYLRPVYNVSQCDTSLMDGHIDNSKWRVGDE